jgi:2-polyprenyl-3-methyl-5-hydroxy-6-metoxy-1,4-benzoquinol methylase
MSLVERSSHFEFGENWKDYSRSIDKERIDHAVAGIQKLFPDGINGKTFLDIGSGSGLHSLAALMLGAKSVTSIDIDENSIEATRALLTSHAPGKPWTAEVVSIFDAPSDMKNKFDIVYSWGVLHHTGDMWLAIEKASELVKDGGQFCIAIYASTRSERFWTNEKAFYRKAPKFLQWIVRQFYMAAYLAAKLLVRQNPISYVRNYKANRGMNFSHDAHDWLGGYPYEAARAEELHQRISALGFSELRSFRLPYTTGVFGAGCHEFVLRKGSSPQ